MGQPAYHQGGIIRGDRTKKEIALVFTGDEYGDGLDPINSVLDSLDVKASFFFTGRFYRNPEFKDAIAALHSEGHYLGAHSDQHLLYCSWEDRDSLLVTRDEFRKDLLDNYLEMKGFGIRKEKAHFFLPAYEWYNDRISEWTDSLGLQLVNYTPGTRSHADYTTPDMDDHYVSSDQIFDSILSFESKEAEGLNGFILLSHVGVDPRRTDKFYLRLGPLIAELTKRGYDFVRIDELLAE